MESSAPRVAARIEQPRCPFCHEDVEPGVPQLACNGCRAWHHEACWLEGGRCAACGAARTGLAGPPHTDHFVAPRATHVGEQRHAGAGEDAPLMRLVRLRWVFFLLAAVNGALYAALAPDSGFLAGAIVAGVVFAGLTVARAAGVGRDAESAGHGPQE